LPCVAPKNRNEKSKWGLLNFRRRKKFSAPWPSDGYFVQERKENLQLEEARKKSANTSRKNRLSDCTKMLESKKENRVKLGKYLRMEKTRLKPLRPGIRNGLHA